MFNGTELNIKIVVLDVDKLMDCYSFFSAKRNNSVTFSLFVTCSLKEHLLSNGNVITVVYANDLQNL